MKGRLLVLDRHHRPNTLDWYGWCQAGYKSDSPPQAELQKKLINVFPFDKNIAHGKKVQKFICKRKATFIPDPKNWTRYINMVEVGAGIDQIQAEVHSRQNQKKEKDEKIKTLDKPNLT